MTDEITNLKELKALESQLIKLYGEDYYPITQKRKKPPIEFISTGCYSLDKVMGGGIPRSYITEISGQEGSLKTTLLLQMIKSCQQQKLICAYIDVECSMNPEYAEAMGVNLDNLMYLSNQFCAEQYIEALRLITKDKLVDVTFLDSISAMMPKKVVEGDVGDATMGLMARFWSSHLPEIVPHLSKNKTSLVIINQLRDTLNMYGPKSTGTGGRALKYYKGLALEVKKKEVIKTKGIESAIKIEVKNAKTKVGVPYISRELTFHFPKFPGDKAGIDTISDIVDTALEEGIISRSGSSYKWHSFPTKKTGEAAITGKEAVYEFFKQNTNLLDLLKEDLLNNTNYDTTSTDQEDFSEEDYSEEAA